MIPLRLQATLKSPLATLRRNMQNFLKRRPHRSFRLTRRRDYVRSLRLPGYWRFTAEVLALLWKNKRLFGLLVAVYAVLTALLVGIASESTYRQTVTAVQETGSQLITGGLGSLEQAGMVFIATVSGGVNGPTNASQQVYAGLIGLLVWLTAVWLLRALLAGQRPRLRDGLYNAGAPLVSTFLVTIVLVVQLLPIAVVIIGYGAAVASGLLAGGVEAMLFWMAASLLTMLSLYWATSTFMALIVVTLPGMYPLAALRTAGDLAVGRRLRILVRILWVLLWLGVVWAVVMIPLIIFDTWLKTALPGASWLPLVPVALLVLGAISIVMLAAYIYLLYRKVVEDDAAPATN